MSEISEEQRAQREEAAKNRVNKADMYRQVFDSEAGRTVLKELEGRCWMYQRMATICPDGKIDPMALAFREGQRDVFIWLMNNIYIAKNPGTYLDRYTAENREAIGEGD